MNKISTVWLDQPSGEEFAINLTAEELCYLTAAVMTMEFYTQLGTGALGNDLL